MKWIWNNDSQLLFDSTFDHHLAFVRFSFQFLFSQLFIRKHHTDSGFTTFLNWKESSSSRWFRRKRRRDIPARPTLKNSSWTKIGVNVTLQLQNSIKSRIISLVIYDAIGIKGPMSRSVALSVCLPNDPEWCDVFHTRFASSLIRHKLRLQNCDSESFSKCNGLCNVPTAAALAPPVMLPAIQLMPFNVLASVAKSIFIRNPFPSSLMPVKH